MFKDIVSLVCACERVRPCKRMRARARVRAPNVRVCACVYVRPCARAYVPTKSPKNRAMATQNRPHPSKKIPFSIFVLFRKIVIVPKRSNYLIRLLIFASMLTF